jgi:type VI secretion system protein ImpL
VDSVFQPVQTLTPGNVTDRLIGAGNKSYMDALLQLTASLEQAATARGAAGEAAAGQAAGNAVAAKTAARQIASGFTADPLGHVDGTVQDLLIAPIAYAEPMLRNFGADEINAAGQSFCARVRPILAKFPFNPDATAQASVAEVSALLKPGSGSMWTFYNEKLQTALPKQGNQFVPAAGGTLRVAPGFVTLLNRAAAFSDVLFKEDPQEPRLTLQVEPQTSEAVGTVSFTTEGQTVRSTRGGNTEQARITWTGTGRESRIAGQVGGAELSIGPFDGAWGMFRLFYMAEPFQPTPGLQRIEWMMRQGIQRVTLADGSPAKIVVNVTAGPAAAILRRGYFAGAECPGAIAR